MSTPTITDPASSITNDPSVVVANDQANATAATDLDVTTNVVQFKGYRVYTGCGLLDNTVNQSAPSDFFVEIHPRELKSFIRFHDTGASSNSSQYVDMSMYALPYNKVGNDKVFSNLEGLPNTITAQLQRAQTPTVVDGFWSNVGSALTLTGSSVSALETITTLDLSAQTSDDNYPYHRVHVNMSQAGYGGEGYVNPVFVVVTVRLKDRSF